MGRRFRVGQASPADRIRRADHEGSVEGDARAHWAKGTRVRVRASWVQSHRPRSEALSHRDPPGRWWRWGRRRPSEAIPVDVCDDKGSTTRRCAAANGDTTYRGTFLCTSASPQSLQYLCLSRRALACCSGVHVRAAMRAFKTSPHSTQNRIGESARLWLRLGQWLPGFIAPHPPHLKL